MVVIKALEFDPKNRKSYRTVFFYVLLIVHSGTLIAGPVPDLAPFVSVCCSIVKEQRVRLSVKSHTALIRKNEKLGLNIEIL